MQTLRFFSPTLLLLAVLVGCGSKKIVELVSSIPPLTAPVTVIAKVDTAGQKLLATGLFVTNADPTSGNVSVYEKAGQRTLVFTNFKTVNGPDLRIYLAENTALRNFVELTRLNNSGNFTLDLPASIDPTKQKFVLIWCKDYSILFGNAELK